MSVRLKVALTYQKKNGVVLALSESVPAAVFAQQKIPCVSRVATKSFIQVVCWCLIGRLGYSDPLVFNRLVFFS